MLEEECERKIAKSTAALSKENKRLSSEAKEALEAQRRSESMAKEMESMADVSLSAATGYFTAVSSIAEQREELVNDLVTNVESFERVVEKETDMGYGTLLQYSRSLRARRDQVQPMPIAEDDEPP